MNDRPPKDKNSTNSLLYRFAPLRLCVTLWGILCTLLPTLTTAQTIYTVVLGNQIYVVGSSTLRSGLFVSYDSAKSWKHIGPENLKAYSMDAVDSSEGRILYIAAGNGVHRSTDYGKSWEVVTDWRMTEVMDVLVDQRSPNYIYTATAFGFWMSRDGGDTWENPEGPLKERYCYEISNGSSSNLISVLCSSSTDSLMYYSTDTAKTWKSTGRWKAKENQHYYDFINVGNRVLIASYEERLSYYKKGSSPHFLDTVVAYPFSKPVHALDILRYYVNPRILAGTFGDGLYIWSDNKWSFAGLSNSQVWDIVVKIYSVPVEVGHEHEN